MRSLSLFVAVSCFSLSFLIVTADYFWSVPLWCKQIWFVTSDHRKEGHSARNVLVCSCAKPILEKWKQMAGQVVPMISVAALFLSDFYRINSICVNWDGWCRAHEKFRQKQSPSKVILRQLFAHPFHRVVKLNFYSFFFGICISRDIMSFIDRQRYWCFMFSIWTIRN